MRISYTHSFNLLIQFIIWGTSLIAGIILAVVFQDIEVLSIIGFFVGVIGVAVILIRYLEPYSTKWYLLFSCGTTVSTDEAKKISFLFDGSLNGKWYPMKSLLYIPEEFRREVLFDFANKIIGYKIFFEFDKNENTKNNDKGEHEKSTENEKPENIKNDTKYSQEHIKNCEFFGINNDYDESALKQRYKYLIKKYHPDVVIYNNDNQKEKAHEIMCKINSTYSFLKEEIQKNRPTPAST